METVHIPFVNIAKKLSFFTCNSFPHIDVFFHAGNGCSREVKEGRYKELVGPLESNFPPHDIVKV